MNNARHRYHWKSINNFPSPSIVLELINIIYKYRHSRQYQYNTVNAYQSSRSFHHRVNTLNVNNVGQYLIRNVAFWMNTIILVITLMEYHHRGIPYWLSSTFHIIRRQWTPIMSSTVNSRHRNNVINTIQFAFPISSMSSSIILEMVIVDWMVDTSIPHNSNYLE